MRYIIAAVGLALAVASSTAAIAPDGGGSAENRYGYYPHRQTLYAGACHIDYACKCGMGKLDLRSGGAQDALSCVSVRDPPS
jgi:hypothetical protein